MSSLRARYNRDQASKELASRLALTPGIARRAFLSGRSLEVEKVILEE